MFYVLFFARFAIFVWLMKSKRAQRFASFYKECKRTQRMPSSFIKNVKEHKNIAFFWKELMPKPGKQGPVTAGADATVYAIWFSRDRARFLKWRLWRSLLTALVRSKLPLQGSGYGVSFWPVRPRVVGVTLSILQKVQIISVQCIL